MKKKQILHIKSSKNKQTKKKTVRQTISYSQRPRNDICACVG